MVFMKNENNIAIPSYIRDIKHGTDLKDCFMNKTKYILLLLGLSL